MTRQIRDAARKTTIPKRITSHTKTNPSAGCHETWCNDLSSPVSFIIGAIRELYLKQRNTEPQPYPWSAKGEKILA